MREASRNQDQGPLKQKHGGLNINAKHMQHVVQGLPHARGLAHNLLNEKPHPIFLWKDGFRVEWSYYLLQGLIFDLHCLKKEV